MLVFSCFFHADLALYFYLFLVYIVYSVCVLRQVFFSLIPVFIPFYQLFLQLCHILTGNCSLLNLLSMALSFSLLDDDHFNSSNSPKKKKGQEKKSRSMTSYL